MTFLQRVFRDFVSGGGDALAFAEWFEQQTGMRITGTEQAQAMRDDHYQGRFEPSRHPCGCDECDGEPWT